MMLLDPMTQGRIFPRIRPALSSHGTCNLLASFKHISILEGESKCTSCSWGGPLQKVTGSDFRA